MKDARQAITELDAAIDRMDMPAIESALSKLPPQAQLRKGENV